MEGEAGNLLRMAKDQSVTLKLNLQKKMDEMHPIEGLFGMGGQHRPRISWLKASLSDVGGYPGWCRGWYRGKSSRP